MGESLNDIMKDMRKTCEEFMGEFNPEEMDTSELREQISKSITSAEVAKDYFQEAFTAMQESMVEEIGIVMADIIDRNIDRAYLRLRNLRDELVSDINITKEKELR